MPGEFLQGIQVGANIANLRVMQQERMMQLRSQEALRAVQERELSARADYYLQQAELSRVKEARADALAKATGDAFDNATGTTVERIEQILPAVMRADPDGLVSQRLASAYHSLRSGQAATEGAFQPVIEGVKDPTTGRILPVLRTGPKSAQMVEPKSTDELEELRRIHLASQNETDPEIAKLYRALLVKKTQATGMTIKTNPDGTFEVVQGPIGGPDQLTKTNQSKVQESQAQSLATIDVANRLEPLISDETVGARAFAESWIKDRILAQQFPELASEKRANAEQLASQLRASAVKELRSDSNITEGERRQIMQAIPQINDPVDSPARAKRLVQDIRKMSAVRAMVAAKRLGGAVPKQAAMALDDEELLDLWKQGLITQDQAKEAYQLKRKQE